MSATKTGAAGTSWFLTAANGLRPLMTGRASGPQPGDNGLGVRAPKEVAVMGEGFSDVVWG